MALTYQLIASNTLTSSAASVTFSSIPGTYTDLVLRMSLKDTATTSATNVTTSAVLRFNGVTATEYSFTNIEADGTTAASTRLSNFGSLFTNYAISGTNMTNTFSSHEIYIPNYTNSTNKPLSSIDAVEANQTKAYLFPFANLWRNTAAITSISLAAGGTAFASNSSFWLYGIKKD